jgi:4-alpha-glucanotransferase
VNEPVSPVADTDDWGILLDWVDAEQQPQRLSDVSARRLRELIGRPPADFADHAPIVTRRGRDLGLGAVTVRCEDGSTVDVEGVLPADFPLGYHVVRTRAGVERRLIVSPGRCSLPADVRAWGWAVQLYAVRSEASWGIGDLADLRRLGTWGHELGAGYLLVNPLHAVAPTYPQAASPYLPVTRRFRNPIYLCVDEVPGVDRVDLRELTAAGRRLNTEPHLDRDASWRLKSEALERIFTAQPSPAGFERWRRRKGPALEQFATWCALAERHGADWHRWDETLRRPEQPAVADFALAEADRVTFHAWLQWLIDRQLQAATDVLPVIQDLPVGVDGGGADAWAWQEQLVIDAGVGAPPDLFNTAGQDWGSPPFNPWRLRADGYQAFVESVRATLANAGGLRIDHVIGLFRLWWVPTGAPPKEGGYVRFPSADLLDIVALESSRAGAMVVGEDLGTVEAGVREALVDHRLLSSRLLWFEDLPPAEWPSASMAAVTTHDLPTVAGLWTGSDLAEQRRHLPASDRLERGRGELLAHLVRPGGPSRDATPEEAVLAAYRLLAEAPSALLCATLDDAVTSETRPNLPGAGNRLNWCIPLPVPLEELMRLPSALALAGVLREAVQPPSG